MSRIRSPVPTLSLGEFDEILGRFIAHGYNEHEHSQTGAAPHVRWRGQGFIPRMSAHPEDIDLLLPTIGEGLKDLVQVGTDPDGDGVTDWVAVVQNLTVDRIHTYYVIPPSSDGSARGPTVLVHNCFTHHARRQMAERRISEGGLARY